MKKIIVKILCITLVASICASMPLFVSAAGSEYFSTGTLNRQNEKIVLYNRAWFYSVRTIYTGYESHYKTNSELENGMGYIYNQKTCPQFSIGAAKMADVGCEIAAVYNAIKCRGTVVSCSDIIKVFERDGYLMTQGYLGSDPYAIGDYFDKNIAYKTTEYTDYDTFNDYVMDNISNPSSANVYIVSFWNSNSIFDGLHTVCIYSCLGSLYVYNLYSNSTAPSVKSSLSEFVDSETFIVGYFVPRMGRMIN